MAAITERLCGTQISASQVSRAAQLLDEELETWRNRPLGEVIYLYLDARYEKVRQAGSVRDAAILMASGVKSDGKRTILGISVSLSEAEAHWRAFLEGLVKRGLHGVQLIISDDHAGMEAARKAVFTGIPCAEIANSTCSRMPSPTFPGSVCAGKSLKTSARYSMPRIEKPRKPISKSS